jgi:acyl carrier protein
VFEKVRDMIEEQLGTNPGLVTMETDILKDLGADSIDIMELLMTMEEEFGISIPDDKIQSLKTVGDFVSYAEQNS